MSIFNRVADAHSKKIADEKKAADAMNQKTADELAATEQRFTDAINTKVVPFFDQLKNDITAKGFEAEVKFSRDGYDRLSADLKFVPKVSKNGNAALFGVDGRDSCVFRLIQEKSGVITWISFHDQHTEGSEAKGSVALAELNEVGLQGYLETFFAKSFQAAEKRK